MNYLETWTHTPFAKALGWSLIHFLWEGALIALLAAALLFLCRRGSARLRYTLACLALATMVAGFAFTFVLLLPRPQPNGLAPIPIHVTPWSPLSAGGSPTTPVWQAILSSVLPWVAPLWMAGVLFFYLGSLGSWMAAQRLRRAGVCAAPDAWQARLHRLCLRMQLSTRVVLLESCLVDVPAVMGFLRPVVLMPMGLLAGLSTDQVESILVHELAHIRRWDYVVNLMQNLVEGLLFYHPAVWWVSGQIRAERENCCDDVVVTLKGDARGYAAALATLEQNRWPAHEPVLAATGGSLMKRIRRLLQEPERHRASAAPVFVAGLLVVSLGVAVASWQTTPPNSAPEAAQVPAQSSAPPAGKVAVRPAPSKPPVALLAQARPAQDQRLASTTETPSQYVQEELNERMRQLEQLKAINEKMLADPYRKWLTEDVAYIISDEERAAFKKLQDKAEQEHFIEQFWLRRDPTPGTSENEYREEHYRRIAYTNDHYSAQVPGWKTDRGRIYITYGPPDEIESHASGGSYRRPPEEGGGETTTIPFEQWRYRWIQGVGSNVIIEFVDPLRTGEYRMTTDPAERDAARYVNSAKTGVTAQVMSTPAPEGKAVLISIPLGAYGTHAVNILGIITSLTHRPVQNFEHTIQGPASADTRFVVLAPGSYLLNVVVKDVATGILAHEEIPIEVK